jgi:O-antigen ligase
LAGITVRASQIFSLFALIAWILIFLIKKKDFNAKNPLLIPIFIFFGSALISLINAQNIQRGIITLLFTIFTIAISIVIPNIIKSKNNLEKVIKIILISSVIVSLFGIYQFIGDVVGLPEELTGLREHYTKKVFGFPRVHSVSTEPLYFANYLLIPISILLAFVLSKKKIKLPFSIIATIFILALTTLSLILTLSRGGYLALAFLFFLFGIFFIRSVLTLKNVIIISTILITAIVSAYGFLLFTDREKNIEIFLKQATTYTAGAGVEERFDTYDQSISMIKEYPVIGGGIGNFGSYVARNPNMQPKDGWAIVNNEFLEIWAEQGIIGLLIFLSLIFIIIIRSIKALGRKNIDPYLKTILIGLLFAFLAILVQYQTFSTLYVLHIWFLVGLIVATQNMIFKYNKSSSSTLL